MLEKALIFCVFIAFEIIFTVSGHCIDIHSQVVSQGLHYVPGPNTCTLCICDKGSPKWCKSVLCSPPQNCKSFQVGNSCCEFKCLDDILTANDGYKETYDFALRVIASAITAILTLSIIFFVLHRLRKRKGRVHQSRQLNDDQRSLNSIGYITGNLGYIPGNISYLGSGNSELEYHYEEASAHYSLWKPASNYFPRGEAPPPYEEAIRSAQVENNVTNNQICTMNNNISVVNTSNINITTVRPTQSVQVNVSQSHMPSGTLRCHHSNLTTSTLEYANIPGPNVTVHHASDANVKNNKVSGTANDPCEINTDRSSLQNKSRKRADKSVVSKSYENILSNSVNDRPTTSTDTKNCKPAISRDCDHGNIDKRYGKYENTKNHILAQKRMGKIENNCHSDLYNNGGDVHNESIRHRTIPNVSEYENISSSSRIKASKSKDTVYTLSELNIRHDFDKLKYDEQSEGDSKGFVLFNKQRDVVLHRTLPKNLKELTRPIVDSVPNEISKKNKSAYRSFPKQFSSYDAIKSNCSLLDKSNEATPSVPPPVRLSILEIKNQISNKEEEKSFISSYQCLSSSQDDDDYRSECENCKSSAFTNGADDSECDVLTETMTLQRRPLESAEETPYFRTSLTLPTHTRKPSRIMTPNSGRESWFAPMQETSSSDESN